MAVIHRDAPRHPGDQFPQSQTPPRQVGKSILCRTLASLRECVWIDPVMRRAEVLTLADAGALLLTDQTAAAEWTLASIACTLPMELVYSGVAGAPK